MGQGGDHGIRNDMPGLAVREQKHRLLCHIERMIEQGGLGEDPEGVIIPIAFDIAMNIHH